LTHNTAKILSVLALGVGAAISSVPAHADDMSDLKALIKELKGQVNEQKAQVRDLKAQVGDLNAQVRSQKTQVSDQGAQVQNQSAVLQKVEAQQQALEQKQAAAPAPAATIAADAKNPGYYTVPGTSTSVKIGGYVKLDVVDDVSGNLGTGAFTKTATDFTSIPLDKSQASHRNGQVNFTAQESRLNMTTLTQTDSVGEVKSVIESDFYGNGRNNSGNVVRLRHAYVSAAGFTAGQTWSTFMDLDTAGPETLDFDGPVGYAFIRQPQIRYSAALPAGGVDVAVESPSGDIATSNADNHIDKAPDLIAKYSLDPSWGHVALAGLGRYLATDSGLSGQHANKMVYGVMAGLGIKTFGKDMLVFQTVDGNGVGRYMNQGQGVSAIQVGSSLKPINIWGGTVGYTHFWTDALRSNVAYGYDKFGTPTGESAAQTPIKNLSSVHANLIWSPWTSADVGLEYIYGHLETSTPQFDSGTRTWASKGSASRIEGSVKYSF